MRTTRWILALPALLALTACDSSAKVEGSDVGQAVDEGDGSVELGDADGDGFDATEDCNDGEPTINPAAVEVCDGVDNDCDGVVDNADDMPAWFPDEDGDGFGDAVGAVEACDAPSGFVDNFDDCDDADRSVYPEAEEVCDGIDNDCDGLVDDDDDSLDASTGTLFYVDVDEDGFGDPLDAVSACLLPEGRTPDDSDCDDLNAFIHPDATEVCDDVDNDCDGQVDTADDSLDASTYRTFYGDSDGDGYGVPDVVLEGCSLPSGYSTEPTDCNDSDASISPAVAEVCDDIDNDCDDLIDDSDDNLDLTTATVYYSDVDGDSFGDSTESGLARCDDPSTESYAYVTDATDCDDSRAAVSPAADEVCDAADVDEDCNGVADDADSGVDSTTTSSWYVDGDEDGYGDGAALAACDDPSDSTTTYATVDTDCDDADFDINPAATEVCDSANVDEDCDGLADDADDSVEASGTTAYYADSDGDGYGDLATTGDYCDDPSTGSTIWVTDATDCDDTDSAISPAASEVCDAADVDEDCDELSDDDDSSTATSGMTTWTIDSDTDGYGDRAATGTDYCDDPSDSTTTYVADATDCDDADSGVSPGADEICDAADVDEDCDGLSDDDDVDVDVTSMSDWAPDSDGDGYGDDSVALAACDDPSTSTSAYVEDATDCDDGDSTINPAATEVCDAGDVDEDCDELADDDDPSATGTTTYYPDADEDGYGDLADAGTDYCDDPSTSTDLWTTDNTDCLDSNDEVNPDGTEVCNGLDDDCDAATSEDGTVRWEPDSGAASSLTSSWSAGTASSVVTWTETDDGTLRVCAGTWYVKAKVDSGASVDIVGPGGSAVTFLDGGGSDRVLEIRASSDVSLTGLTLQDGDADKGAAIKVQDSTLTGDDIVLSSSYADGVGGGALWVRESTVTLTGCEITGNEATSDGGGLFAEAGSVVLLSTCDISSNVAGADGGGVFIDREGDFTATGSTFDSNVSGDDGGGLYGENTSTLTVSGSSFTDNVASGWGGGIGSFDDASLTLSGSTLDGNEAVYGGGVYSEDATTITSCVLSNNDAFYEGGGWFAYIDDVSATISSSTLSSNTAGYWGEAIGTEIYTSSHTVSGSSLTESGHTSQPLSLYGVNRYALGTSFTCGSSSCY